MTKDMQHVLDCIAPTQYCHSCTQHVAQHATDSAHTNTHTFPAPSHHLQVGFFDIVALPLFQSFSQKFPEAEPLLAAVKENYEMWKDESPSPVAAGSAAGSGGSFSTAASALANGRTGSGLLSKAHSGGGGLLALRTTSSAGGSLAQANA